MSDVFHHFHHLHLPIGIFFFLSMVIENSYAHNWIHVLVCEMFLNSSIAYYFSYSYFDVCTMLLLPA